MNRIAWQGLLPPAVMPFTVSIAVALAGPGGLLGLTADRAAELTPYVADGTPANNRQARDEEPAIATETPVATPDATPAPESTSAATPTPATGIVAVPPGTAPPRTPVPPSPAPPPPGHTATPQPTPPAPTPSPRPVDETEACTLAAAYARLEMASLTVQVKSCSAKRIAGGWEVTLRIRHPGCAALDAQGLPCANSPLKLTFFVSDADRSVAAADAETAAILETY